MRCLGVLSNHEMNSLFLGLESKIDCENCRLNIGCDDDRSKHRDHPLHYCFSYLPETPVCKTIGCRGFKGIYCRTASCVLVTYMVRFILPTNIRSAR